MEKEKKREREREKKKNENGKWGENCIKFYLWKYLIRIILDLKITSNWDVMSHILYRAVKNPVG